MNDSVPGYFKYWGKTSKEGENQVRYHLLPYHCLDVAAVGFVILNKNHSLLNRLSKLAGLNSEEFITWMAFFLALHDLGKFADSFQNLNQKILLILQKRTSKRVYGGLRHDSLGSILWFRALRKELQTLGVMRKVHGSKRRQVKKSSVDVWVEAVTGHHGQPAKQYSNRSFSDDFQEPQDLIAAKDFLQEICSVFLQNSQFIENHLSQVRNLSWWIAGFTVLCDWLGSNSNYFPYKVEIVPLDSYWPSALEHADRAVKQTGLLPIELSSQIFLSQLISAEQDDEIISTPLQQQACDFQLTDSPHLFILEDVTGAGKTEAAVLLAHRSMLAGHGQGVYFALPTMATANSMYSRMAKAYRYLFTQNSLPSLILAHGAREMSREFRQSIMPWSTNKETNYGDETTPADAHCNAWLADNRKKSLLADIGIGTIDQALLAILPSRHQCLRLLGLLNKVLIVDEVHACDAYMNELLCALLKAHSIAGGSAILLSATLPLSQRQALLDAYAEGRNWREPVLEATDFSSYPLFTSMNNKGTKEQVVDTRENVKREVHVKLVYMWKDMEILLTETVAAGKCACWIRNTVADARETFSELQKKHPDWNIDLFHARFILGDRLDIENRVVQRFGEASGGKKRKGRILIATQVVEQSLDLDFDEMITDLAPIDLIIQRAGRLRRHSRDISGNRIKGKDRRGKITVHVFSPPVVENPSENWFAGFFERAKKVYQHHGQLFLTARLLQSKGCFKMPGDARELIESVYGPKAQADIPDTLLENSITAEGEDRAAASIARLNALYIPGGYSGTDETVNRWWDEAITPTRLGEETIMVYLACYQNNTLMPLRREEHHSWQHSSLSVRTYGIAGEAESADIPLELIEECKNQLPARGKWGVLVPMSKIGADLWQGLAKNNSEETVNIYYHAGSGLMLESEYQQFQENG